MGKVADGVGMNPGGQRGAGFGGVRALPVARISDHQAEAGVMHADYNCKQTSANGTMWMQATGCLVYFNKDQQTKQTNSGWAAGLSKAHVAGERWVGRGRAALVGSWQPAKRVS